MNLLFIKETPSVFLKMAHQVLIHKKKVKWSRYRPGVAQRVGRGIALLFHDRGTRRGWVVNSTPRAHFTPEKDAVLILQEAGWAQDRSGRAENLILTGIRSRTIQPVVSRYTDWATRPTHVQIQTSHNLEGIDIPNSEFKHKLYE